ncbi:hypothetical protein GOV06_04005 [Candidatus Woesearchaeota archaeon]|nr:hypothetical protein [Candidatus Woesearchaeota archaeon]
MSRQISKKWIVSLMIITVLAFVVFAAAPTYGTLYIGAHNRISNGLLGEWRFEGNAVDETEINNGTITGAISTDEGRVGKAYEFNGISSYITAPNSASLNVTGALTIGFWANFNDPASNGAIISKYDSGGGQRSFLVQTVPVHCNANEIGFTVSSTGAAFNGRVRCSNNVLTTGWHHVVAVFKPSDTLEIYIDGNNETAEYGFGAVTPASIYGSNRDLAIGASFSSSTTPNVQYFNGTIDEVLIFNRSLLLSEIEEIYNTSKGEFADVNQDLGAAANSSGEMEGDIKNIYNWFEDNQSLTVLNMPFEGDQNSSNAEDYSSHDNNGTLVGGTNWQATGGYDGKGAFDFPGTDDYITSGNDLSNNNEGTVVAWIKTDDVNYADQTILSIKEGTDAYSSMMYRFYDADAGQAYSGKVNLLIKPSSTVTLIIYGDTVLQSNTWYHVAWVGSSSGHKIYVNGEEESLTYYTGNSGIVDWWDDMPASSKWDIGSLYYNNDYIQEFNGIIDEVLIFNRSLTPEQIRILYKNQTQTIVSEETLDGDVWQACITPNNGTRDGDTKCSDNLTLLDLDVNYPPTHTQPILNSTYDTNLITENLTVYPQNTYDADADDVKNIINWYKDESSIAVLNMPFEGGSNDTFTKDYSGYGNNGTVTGSTWDSSGGYDGKGAYDFEGDTSYISLSSTVSMAGDWTISTWTNFPLSASTSTWRTLARGSDVDHYVIVNTNGYLGMYDNDDGGGWVACSPTYDTDSLSGWKHLVAVGTGTKTVFYINGVNVCNSSTKGDGNLLSIGGHWGGSQDWGSYLDDFTIWNTSLSGEQVAALYNNRTDLIVSQETSVGETWKACITPNDGTQDGAENCSNNLTVVPEFNAALNYPSDENNSVDLLGDVIFNCSAAGNNLVNITLYHNINGTWKNNGTTVVTGSSNSTTFTRDIKDIVGNDTIKDSTYRWNCRVCKQDGGCKFADSNYTFSGWDLGRYLSVKMVNLTSIIIPKVLINDTFDTQDPYWTLEGECTIESGVLKCNDADDDHDSYARYQIYGEGPYYNITYDMRGVSGPVYVFGNFHRFENSSGDYLGALSEYGTTTWLYNSTGGRHFSTGFSNPSWGTWYPINVVVNQTVNNITASVNGPVNTASFVDANNVGGFRFILRRGYNLAYSEFDNLVVIQNTNRGRYISSVKDVESNVSWNTVTWDEIITPGVNNIILQLRTCNDSACSGEPWQINCTDSSSCNINSLNQSRYIQYQVIFNTSTIDNSPELLANSVIIQFGETSCTDIDEDGYGDVNGNYGTANGCPYDESDCDDDNILVNPGMPENYLAVCTDSLDNDCDGLYDMNDPGCSAVPEFSAPGILFTLLALWVIGGWIVKKYHYK